MARPGPDRGQIRVRPGSDPDLTPRRVRLADRLAVGRRRRFCGRTDELAAFRGALTGEAAPTSVFYVHGLGGVGKSALLRAFAATAGKLGVPTALVDGRIADPSPGGFLVALRDALGLREDESPLDHLRGLDRLALLIDGYELLVPIDEWLRRECLPQLPARAVVAIAGRQPPPVEWRSDLGWAPLVRTIPLRNLTPSESRALLAARGVGDRQQKEALEFTHGHPLALVLVADALRDRHDDLPFSADRVPNVVRELLARIVDRAPDAVHRRALELCAHARVTNESLLGALVEGCDSHELFEWLRRLSFIEEGPEGLFPHDIARSVLSADFRWRDPDAFRDIHQRLWAHVLDRLRRSTGHAQQRAFFDKLYLHRMNPIGGRYHDYGTLGTLYAEPAEPRDHDDIVKTVRRHEGQESARIAAYWLRQQPEAFKVLRGVGGGLLGFASAIVLRGDATADEEKDPAAQRARAFARARGPLRRGEEIRYHRFHMACDVYQQVSPMQNLLALMVTLSPMQPAVAWSLLAMAEADPWRPIMDYINFQRVADADFIVGDREYAVFAHDWRVESFDDWWRRETERSLRLEPDPGAAIDAPRSPLVVLSEPEFAASVRHALRDYTRPDALRDNPLLRSRVVVEATSGDPGVARLQALLREAVERLKGGSREDKFHRALWLTYIEPAPSQERAAERLNLPFGTYRYHLSRGTERVVNWLWRRELHGAG